VVLAAWTAPKATWWLVTNRPSPETNEPVAPTLTMAKMRLGRSGAKMSSGSMARPFERRSSFLSSLRGYMPSSEAASPPA
jgi:hypothetical protein